MLGSFESANEWSMVSAPSLHTSTSAQRIHGFLTAKFTKFIDRWFALQLAHYGGKYSVERMLALEEYTRNTSIDRVLLVIFGVPLLVIALVLVKKVFPFKILPMVGRPTMVSGFELD